MRIQNNWERYFLKISHCLRQTPVQNSPRNQRIDTGGSLNFNENGHSIDSSDITIPLSQPAQGSLYHIKYDRESGLFKAKFNREEELHTPDLNETYNFRFFHFIKPDEITDLPDSEQIIDVKRFFGLLRVGILNKDREYIIMRWSLGFDCWTASKYNRFKAKDFLKSYCFVNCLLSKSARGMHYEEQSLDFF